MPQLSDLVKKRADKKFTKKSYRPWDLSGTGTTDPIAMVPSQSIMPKEHPILETTHTLNKTQSANPGNDTGIITDNNQVTIRKQIDNNQITGKKQPDNKKVTSKEQPEYKIDNNSDNVESIVFLSDSIRKLTGIQQKIFFYVIDLCSSHGLLETGVILTTDLMTIGNCSFGSAKTSLARLIDKKLILRKKGKASRGGHIVLGITEEIQAAALYTQRFRHNPLIKTLNLGNNIDNKPGNNHPYSSSNLNIYKTTTSLPDDWKNINFEILSNIGFSETQLKQLYETHLTAADVIQESINHLAYGLINNEKTKAYKDPLNVFMGVLRKGQRWLEADYASPQEVALKQIVEEKKKSKDRRDSLIKELVDIEFPDWRKKLTDSEIKQIVPEVTLKMDISAAITASLRTHYVEKILIPKLEKNDIISN